MALDGNDGSCSGKRGGMNGVPEQAFEIDVWMEPV